MRDHDRAPTSKISGHGPRKIGVLIDGALDPIARKRGFSSTQILLRWEVVAGASFAAVTRPERIAWPRSAEDEKAGVLHILVRPAAILDVQHAASQIVERVNLALGWRAIRGLKMRQTPFGWPRPPLPRQQRPLPPDRIQALDDRLAVIAEPELRDSLRALGLAALRPRRTR